MAIVKGNILIMKNKKEIASYLEDKSSTISDYINSNNNSEFFMIRKYITHSDLATFGKRSGSDQTLDKNYLYYLSLDEMNEVQNRDGTEFESAKQSNIGVPTILFEKLGIDQLQRREGQQSNNHSAILINEYADVLLVNDTLDYFNSEYTFKIFEKLNKKVNWKSESCNITLSNDNFTPIELRHAIHGVGTSNDKEFHKLRRNIFKHDAVLFLIENTPDCKKTLFIMLDKNPRFFSIINETNNAYENFLLKKEKVKELTEIEVQEIEKTRKYQSKWREKLAAEMKNFTTSDENVFCPFTYIEANFDDVGTLYRASHIKRHKDSTPKEAYDINNGLLLVANADALFDKHLITISENKELIFSFLIENNLKLKGQLMMSNSIFKEILNDKRMEYLEEHRKIFLEKEEERKRN